MFAAAFTGLSFLLFAFVYWQTAGYEQAQLDRMLRREAQVVAADPDHAGTALAAWLREDLHSVRYGVLLARGGAPEAGNIAAVPRSLQLDGEPRYVFTSALDTDSDERAEKIRALGTKLADGRTLVLGNDTDAVEHVRLVILRALGLGLLPMAALSLLAGGILGRRALGRVTHFEEAVSALREGRLGSRLPTTRRRDEFDRLAVHINAMMDEIERLLDDVRSVGDGIAHDLRTPLTRARTRLERSREAVSTPAEFTAAIDEALGWLDQSFAVITAVLRIGEIQNGRRRAAFGTVDLGRIVSEASELYEPIAEEKGVRLTARTEPTGPMHATGDRDLLFEAVANLIDNAIKFSPTDGEVSAVVERRAEGIAIIVADNGPGIMEADRGRVFERFYRAEQSRHREGTGLGLPLVAAIATLHDFRLRIGDNQPGCRVELLCHAAGAASPAGHPSQPAERFDFAPLTQQAERL